MNTICLQCRPCKPRHSSAPVRRGTLMQRRRVPCTTTFPFPRCARRSPGRAGAHLRHRPRRCPEGTSTASPIPTLTARPSRRSRAARSDRWRSRRTRSSCWRPTRPTPGWRSTRSSRTAASNTSRRCRWAWSRWPWRRAANQEAWVVNHLSDSVSVVELDGKKSRVTRTLLVGDEPRDVVFAGPHRSQAFITTAHRGQNSPIDPQLSTPGVGRADVWVFDAASGGASGELGGTPLTILTFFAEMPRALAVTPDGSRVYVAAFHSGNATASTFAATSPASATRCRRSRPRPVPGINVGVNAFGQEQPPTSVIVKYDGSALAGRERRHPRRRDDVHHARSRRLRHQCQREPAGGDRRPYGHVRPRRHDPVQHDRQSRHREGLRHQPGVQQPAALRGRQYLRRFVTNPADSVRGRIAFSRITVLDNAGSVTPRHLNKHIDYSTCCAPIPNAENAKSVAFPHRHGDHADGQTLYVAALGSSEVAVYDTAAARK